jgi:hypothetical protein
MFEHLFRFKIHQDSSAYKLLSITLIAVRELIKNSIFVRTIRIFQSSKTELFIHDVKKLLHLKTAELLLHPIDSLGFE